MPPDAAENTLSTYAWEAGAVTRVRANPTMYLYSVVKVGLARGAQPPAGSSAALLWLLPHLLEAEPSLLLIAEPMLLEIILLTDLQYWWFSPGALGHIWTN